MEVVNTDRMTCQEIVDIYTIKKDFTEMTKQIDIYEPYDFFYELREQFEEFQNHTENWSIYTGIVFEYHYRKWEIRDYLKKEREEEEKRNKIKLLSQFATWIIDGIEIVLIDKEQVRIQIDTFLEEME